MDVVQEAEGLAEEGVTLLNTEVITPVRTFFGSLLTQPNNSAATTAAITTAQQATGTAAAALATLQTAEQAVQPAIDAGGDILINYGLAMIPGGVGSEFDPIADAFWQSVITKATAQLSANKVTPAATASVAAQPLT